MILAWAAPLLQETPPFQQEEFRLRHFQLPAWAAGDGWRADPWPSGVGEWGRELFMPGVSHSLGEANTQVCLRAARLGTDGGLLPLGPLEGAPQESV